MIRQYLKQALQTLKENRLTSTISILGTALSVAMILVLVLQFQIRLTGYVPVSNRSRMLSVGGLSSQSKDKKEENNTGLSIGVVRECIYSLKTPEAVSVQWQNQHVISLPGKRNFEEYRVRYIDTGFWKLFDFRFLAGKPFTEADFQSGLPRAVISDYLASRLFGTQDVVGQEIVMNNVVSYTIAGVVARPTQAASEVYADVWVPYTSNSAYLENSNYGGTGPFSAMLLSRSAADFDVIRAELLQAQARYNSGKEDYTITLHEAFSRLDLTLGSSGWPGGKRMGWTDYLKSTGLVLIFLLLVPTLNLTGVIQSSVQKRRSEMGIRKAFGATNGKLFVQLVTENLAITLIGGCIGILLAVALLYTCRSFLLTKETVLTFGMICKPMLFAAAFFFTLLLNLLSSGLPAFRVVREAIVESLKGDEK